MNELASWVGRPYKEGECWTFVRDAFRELRGIELPESYYDALPMFTTVHDVRRPATFVPQEWDVAMLKTHPLVILHCSLTIDADRFIHPWGGSLVISRFDDPQFQRRIAGFLRHIRLR